MLSTLLLCMRYNLKSLSQVQFKSSSIILNLPIFFFRKDSAVIFKFYICPPSLLATSDLFFFFNPHNTYRMFFPPLLQETVTEVTIKAH